MTDRRKFFMQAAAMAAFFQACIPADHKSQSGSRRNTANARKPVVVSTWKFGIEANAAAWQTLSSGGRALDAVEKGVMVSEADPKVDSVGLGGLPDRDGNVTLDACIMDENGNCGSVVFLEHILHPVSVARKVMETTPHVMLAGEGALRFALENGFQKENLLTPEARTRWEEWLRTGNYNPTKVDAFNHDTIGMIALDKTGNLGGACTTSGLSWKMRGRVGDSPIIGAGLFVDNDYGAATATGKGEAVIKICGSHLIVEKMAQGMSPMEACRFAVQRIVQKQKDAAEFNVGFLALNKDGEVGGYSIRPGFEYAVYADGKNELIKADSHFKQ